MLELLLANQAEMKADRIADRERDRANLKRMMAEMNAKIGKQEEMLAKMR
jgi:hypothetical protein